MKINTKTATPIKNSPHSFQNDNKFIPAAALFHDEDDNNNNSKMGRTILFETVVVSTPVLASSRLNQPESDDKKRLLTKNEVDELNSMLNSLYLDSTTPTKKATIPLKVVEEEEKVVIHKREKESSSSLSSAALSSSSASSNVLGRCSLAVYDDKTKVLVEVSRSARLAFKQ